MIEIKEQAKFRALENKDLNGISLGGQDQTNVSITEYENEVPQPVGKALDDLYGSLYSSMPYMEVHGSLQNANTYTAQKNGKTIAVLLFRLEGHVATIVNEVFEIGEEELARFAEYIFGTYPSIRKIVFNAVSSDVKNLGYAAQHFPGTQYTIVPLPPTEREYTEKLGKSTRRTIQYRLNRVKRCFPSFRHEVQEGADISEQDLLAVIAFNRMRMAGKHKIVDLSQEDIARIVTLVRRCGFISVIRLDGRVCAGTICYRTGPVVMSQVNAHDPQYNEYRLGTLSCYLAICESIRRQAKEFNLQWGGEEYKYAFLGIDRSFDRIQIYRSYPHLLSDAKTILQLKTNTRLRTARTWLIAQSRKNNRFAKCLNSCIAFSKRKKYSDWAQQQENAP